MSVSVTGRHHDRLSLTPRSIRSNGVQAGRGVRGGGAGRDGQGESFLLRSVCSICSDSEGSRKHIYQESRNLLRSAVHFLSSLSLSEADESNSLSDIPF